MGIVLLFHVNMFKANQIATVCKKTGHAVVNVSKKDYNKTIGTLLGIPGVKKETQYSGEEFEHEMMVFFGMNDKMLDIFLAEYKKDNISPIERKAMVTSSNIVWTPLKLYEELEEHAKLAGK